jgi:hypothetical protein
LDCGGLLRFFVCLFVVCLRGLLWFVRTQDNVTIEWTATLNAPEVRGVRCFYFSLSKRASEINAGEKICAPFLETRRLALAAAAGTDLRSISTASSLADMAVAVEDIGSPLLQLPDEVPKTREFFFALVIDDLAQILLQVVLSLDVKHLQLLMRTCRRLNGICNDPSVCPPRGLFIFNFLPIASLLTTKPGLAHGCIPRSCVSETAKPTGPHRGPRRFDCPAVPAGAEF